MAKIQVLDKHVAELIAAGEVVERPASVIKELVENSIDAGSSAVTVEIKHGGVTYMRVTDNGCGIAREDVPTAFLRHATSKVKNQIDLESISTLGFRGEALASIAAVAQVDLLTCTSQSLSGTHYRIEGGTEVSIDDAGCPCGTTIVIRDIFYNTPARMKFLKKDVVEANAVAGVLDKMALSHPEISFRFIRDGRETLHTPGDGQLKSAVYAVYGRDFTKGLMPVSYEYQFVKAEGFVSKPSNSRPNRSMQQFFINGRYVRSKTAAVALEQAFKGSIMVGKFPACVLHLTLSGEAVDVNVHPAKLEVRFINEKPIFDAVYYGVKSALQQYDAPKQITIGTHEEQKSQSSLPLNQISLNIRSEDDSKKENVPLKPNFSVDKIPLATHGSYVKDSVSTTYLPQKSEPQVFIPPLSKPAQNCSSLNISAKPEVPKLPEKENLLGTEEKSLRVIGEVFKTYILAQYGKEEFLLIDKHAAHERILYEKLKKQDAGKSAQMLIQPVAVTLSKEEYAEVLGSKELFAKAGFEIDDFGSGSVLVRSVPMTVETGEIASSVIEMAGYLCEHKTDVTTEKLDWLYHNIACRSAVKAGDSSSFREMAEIAVKLQKNPDIRYCPHGRPVSVVITKHEIEKQFGRI